MKRCRTWLCGDPGENKRECGGGGHGDDDSDDACEHLCESRGHGVCLEERGQRLIVGMGEDKCCEAGADD